MVPALLTEFKHRAQEALPGRVERVVLFGSRARGDAQPDSDWDVAVFLRGGAGFAELKALSSTTYDLLLETGQPSSIGDERPERAGGWSQTNHPGEPS